MTRCLCVRLSALALVTVLGGLTEYAWAVGGVHGVCRFEKIKGHPEAGYQELYEFNVFLSPSGVAVTGPSRRAGTTTYSGSGCYTKYPPGGGDYCIDSMPAGSYSILLAQPEFWLGHPKVVPNVTLSNNQNPTVYVEPPIDYSAYVWDISGNQWTWAQTAWLQTFTATGTNVTGVIFVLADSIGGPVDVSIHESNGDPNPTTWPQVGPTRRHNNAGALTDNWVRWRDGQVPMTPGHQYAVKCAGVGRNLQPLKRNQSPGPSYDAGTAYDASGVAQTFDLCYIVLASNDGTVVTLNKRSGGIGNLYDGYFASAWGQTFVAQGSSLASADVWAAAAGDCGERWDLDFTWKVREEGPTGFQIGPTKTTKAAYFGPGVGLHGVSFNPNEVPLMPGQTYFVEFAYATGPACAAPGFNPLISDDLYSGGHGWQWTGSSWLARTSNDLAMTIMEYEVTGPLIRLNKSAITRTAYVGDTLSSDSFTVKNAGKETLDYTIADGGAAWLNQAPSAGSSTGETDPVSVIYNVASLPCGTHQATIEVSGNAINSPQQIAVTVVIRTVDPDFDCDKDVDQDDFAHLQTCYSGAGINQNRPDCLDARLDDDEDVDLDDFAVLQECMSGANTEAARDCAD